MSKPSTLTEQQIKQVYDLKDTGKSERQIAALAGLTNSRVHTILSKRGISQRQQKIAGLVSSTTSEAARKSVFDIMARLEDCLDEIEGLKDEYGILRDRVAVLTEKRQLIAEARSTLESIYNIRVLNDFITEVTTILEEQSPGARQRIFKRLETSSGAVAAISLFAVS